MTIDLWHHGDQEVGPGLLDLAVNVRGDRPPPWLRQLLVESLDCLGAYPDPTAATAAVAGRHGREPGEVLLTAGGAEAFVLLARVLRPRHAVCIHPSFTEPEAALRAAGHVVHRLVLPPPYALTAVPDQADLVIVGNPTNPTGVVHDLTRLCRPGRIVVVDEAFADAVPGEPASLAGRSDLPGLVVVRSLTKTWALAGLRVGYLLAEPALVHALRRVQPLWSVSTPACVAAAACSSPSAVAEADRAAHEAVGHREHLERALLALGVHVSPGSRAPFLLCNSPQRPWLRESLRHRGIAVRRGETFPGLSPAHWRVAVRAPQVVAPLLGALTEILRRPSVDLAPASAS